ncbi:MAG: hypothetical protein K2H98_07320, partial [Duncaniella sp.]|nr:hypothetical protein [Duncaniella sp.]
HVSFLSRQSAVGFGRVVEVDTIGELSRFTGEEECLRMVIRPPDSILAVNIPLEILPARELETEAVTLSSADEDNATSIMIKEIAVFFIQQGRE